MAGNAQFSDYEHIKGSVESLCYFECDWNAAARESEHRNIGSLSVSE